MLRKVFCVCVSQRCIEVFWVAESVLKLFGFVCLIVFLMHLRVFTSCVF